MEAILEETMPLSPLRRDLCSPIHAARVGKRMRDDGLDVVVLLTGDPLQPWRVVERSDVHINEVQACA